MTPARLYSHGVETFPDVVTMWVELLPRKPKVRIVLLSGLGERQHDELPPDREDQFDMDVKEAYVRRHFKS